MKSSEYIKEQRHGFAMYVLQNRAIPALTDGLKTAARRVMWIAKDGKKYKSASLAGATMPIHPHSSPEGTINTISAPYGNNIPLLTGYGSFGTKLKPTSFGACFIAGSKVKTGGGFTKDINNIEIGENVLSHTGKYNKVIDCNSIIKNNIVKLTFKNSTYTLSDDHYVMIRRNNEFFWAKVSEYNETTDDMVFIND